MGCSWWTLHWWKWWDYTHYQKWNAGSTRNEDSQPLISLKMDLKLSNQSNKLQSQTFVANNKLPTWETWHWRFGHVGYTGLQKLLDGKMVEGFTVDVARLHCVHRGKTTRQTISKIFNQKDQSRWINTHWLMGKVLDQIDQWPSILHTICERCQEICNRRMRQAEIRRSTSCNKLFGTFENPRKKPKGDSNWLWERIRQREIAKLV